MRLIYDSHGHFLSRDTIRADVLFKKLKLPGSSLMGMAIAGDDAGKFTKWIERVIKIYKRVPYFDVDHVLDMFQLDPISYARQLMREMDEAGVDVMFILMIPQDTDAQQRSSYLAHLNLSMVMQRRCELFYGWRLDTFEKSYDMIDGCQNGVISGLKIYPAIRKANNNCIKQLFNVAKAYGLPIILHCNEGGIGEFKEQNKPEFWAPWLEKYPEVNSCFAHGGGEFTKDTQKIVDFIKVNEMTNVFIDLAFHSGAFSRRSDPYFRKLRALNAEIPGHIIGGLSDYPLGSTSATLKKWHETFRGELGDYNYTEIFSYNVERFLGK